MNILQDIEKLKRTGGITILHIGLRTPDTKKHNTFQVKSNGEIYFIDRCGELLRIGNTIPFGNTISSTGTIAPIEVQIGSADAIALGFLDGDTTLVHPLFINNYLEIFIGNINLYSIDKGDGSPYFTKSGLNPAQQLASDTVILNFISLTNTDVLKIKFL